MSSHFAVLVVPHVPFVKPPGSDWGIAGIAWVPPTEDRHSPACR
jgi:hypothetical protein